ncbi:Hypothetical protein CINCED_3A008475 [Cinara cedri]|uniref:Uncharacterized protein n=1 Tax=Cinara cedri TaxID=506608 RepID=A0A5E4M143_9HEMI|nr:Hypothetical protein CINCED_3A008475 [Cinara cedri]
MAFNVDGAPAVDLNDRECDEELLVVNVQEEHGKKMHSLCEVLSALQANFDQFTESCFEVNNKLNQLEMDCIDVLQPIDMILMERHIEHICEMESNLNLLYNIGNVKK